MTQATGAPQRPIRLNAMGCLLVASCLAVMVAFVSGNLNGRFQHKAEVVSQQVAILHNEPTYFDGLPHDLPEFHNRVLIPAILAASTAVFPGTLQQWFIAWRLITAALMFWTMLRLTNQSSWHWPVLAVSLLAYLCILSFAHPWEHPTDFLDATFTLGFCALTLSGRFFALTVLALLAASNRESAAFAGVMWACVHGRSESRRFQFREICRGVGLSTIVYLAVLALRREFAVPGVQRLNALAIVELPNDIAVYLQHPTLDGWPIRMAASLALVLLCVRAFHNQLQNRELRLLIASGFMFAISLVFGKIGELRVFLPVFVVPVYAAVNAAARAEAGMSL